MITVAIAGTLDANGAELLFVVDRLTGAGVAMKAVDLSTDATGTPEPDVTAQDVAAYHPEGASAVLNLSDRGQEVTPTPDAFAAYVQGMDRIGVMFGAGGAGDTSLIFPAMRALPIGVPKILVSVVASGNVAPHERPSNITIKYPVSDIQGLNRISTHIPGNTALFASIETHIERTAQRRLSRVPSNINEVEFAEAALAA